MSDKQEQIYTMVTIHGTQAVLLTGRFSETAVKTFSQWDNLTAITETGEEVKFAKTGIELPTASDQPGNTAPPGYHNWY